MKNSSTLSAAPLARVLLSRPAIGPTTLTLYVYSSADPHFDCLRCALENAAHPTHGINAANPAPGRTLAAELNSEHHGYQKFGKFLYKICHEFGHYFSDYFYHLEGNFATSEFINALTNNFKFWKRGN